MIRVSNRQIETSEEAVTVSFSVSGVGHDRLWFSVDKRFGEMVGDSYDAAAVALLIPAMMSGQPLRIDGACSPELIWNLNHQVAPLLAIARDAQPTSVDATAESDGVQGDGVLTGFSAGIDSLNAVLDHYVAAGVPPALRLTHLIFNDLSSHLPSTLTNERWVLIQKAASEVGLPLIWANSNLSAFCTLNFQKTHTIRNAAIPFLLQSGTRSWLYASGYPNSEIRVGNTHDLAALDPVLLQAMSTDLLRLRSVGTEMNRVEKTCRISNWPVAQQNLNVCTRKVPNCGTCGKCLRTFFTLELLGKLQEFHGVVDIDAYQRSRARYLVDVASGSDFLLREIRDLADETGFGLPLTARAGGVVRRARRALVGELLSSPTLRRTLRPIAFIPGGKRLARWIES